MTLTRPLLLSGLLILGATHPVFAQSIEDNALTDLDAYPLNISGFQVQPRLDLIQQYNDNIFADDQNEESDFITTVNPSISVFREFGRHNLFGNVNSRIIRYASNSQENIENYGAFLGVNLEGYHNLRFPVRVAYRRDHRDRNNERTLNTPTEPLAFDVFQAEAGVEYDINRLETQLTARYEGRRNDDGVTSDGSREVRSDSDYNSYELEAEAGYRFKRGWRPFINLLVGQFDYLRRQFDGSGFNGLSQNNTVVRGLVGLSLDYKDLILGRVGVGYTERFYEESSVDDIGSIAFDADVTFNLSDRAVLSTEAGRRTLEDNVLGRGFVLTEVGGELQYEAYRDLFLKTGVKWEKEEFEGTNSDREDTRIEGSVGAYYVINPRFQIEGGYFHNRRSSNEVGLDYDQNIFQLQLTGKL